MSATTASATLDASVRDEAERRLRTWTFAATTLAASLALGLGALFFVSPRHTSSLATTSHSVTSPSPQWTTPESQSTTPSIQVVTGGS